MFLESFKSYADKIALVDAFGSFSYADLAKQITKYQKQFADLEAGKQVVLLSDYNFYSIALFFALASNKNILIPLVTTNENEINSRLSATHPEYIIRQQGAEFQLEKTSFASKQSDLLDELTKNNQAGLILFSSGTTGEPKAMVHNLTNLLASYTGKKEKNITLLILLMFDHIGGLNTLLNGLVMGSKLVIPANRNPEDIAKLIEQEKVNILPASPTFLNLMLMAQVAKKYDLSSLKMITYGTEPMPESLLLKLKDTFPRTKLLQTFGTSETGISQTSSRSSSSLEIKITDPETEYRIVEGELWLRSKTQVLGYLNASMDSFTEDGWFQTGDLVEEADAGYLRIKGRLKEVINVGGEKVLPAEIESVILQVPEVIDCTVYGAKNALTGQMVAVQLVIAPDADCKEVRKAIRALAREQLETYKIPAKFEFVESTVFNTRFKKQRLFDDE